MADAASHRGRAGRPISVFHSVLGRRRCRKCRRSRSGVGVVLPWRRESRGPRSASRRVPGRSAGYRLLMATDGSPATTSIVVMGVSGSGKSTVAAGLVERLGWEFAEGDDFHPRENVEKMRSGLPLDDDDRRPWLRSLADWIGEREQAGTSVVVTCSALKRSYRDVLRDGHPSVWFAHVAA